MAIKPNYEFDFQYCYIRHVKLTLHNRVSKPQKIKYGTHRFTKILLLLHNKNFHDI